ncbi:MAG TPA: hypothetical protein PLY88_01700 [Candidatus Omnitrophota bacterium]|nr:hypothetical protein [Candidatus Omnitrophota bacterium]
MKFFLSMSFLFFFAFSFTPLAFAEEPELSAEQYNRLMDFAKAREEANDETVTVQTYGAAGAGVPVAAAGVYRSDTYNVNNIDSVNHVEANSVNGVGRFGVNGENANRVGHSDVNQAQRNVNNTGAKAGVEHQRRN